MRKTLFSWERELYIPTKFHYLKTKLVLAILKGIGVVGRTVLRTGKKIAPFFAKILSLFSRIVLLPLYKLGLLLKLRVSKLIGSARGFFFLVFTNRYVFHVVIVIISVFTITGQLQAKKATAMDTANQSLLYALVTKGHEEIIEETADEPFIARHNSYLGSDIIEAVPDIDFDYTDAIEDRPIADLTVPGSVAVLPGGEEAGVPGEVIVPTRNAIETYVIQPGDTIASISKKFGLNVGTITWANNLKNTSIIRPGDSLKILPVSGVIHTVKKGENIGKIASLYKIDIEEISQTNRLGTSALSVGQDIIIPGGTPLVTTAKATPRPIVVGNPSKKVSVRTDIPVNPIRGKSYDVYQEITGSADTRAKPEDITTETRTRLQWPTRLRVINQYYGWNHTGIDVDGDYTDPIYASEDGTVEAAGWNSGGYGLQIVINHENGIKTRYAHASKLFVASGDSVKRGQVIAMVGTTGRSTGTHLHYEVYVNGKRQNPLTYTK